MKFLRVIILISLFAYCTNLQYVSASTSDILETSANNIKGEMNHVAESIEGWFSFLLWLEESAVAIGLPSSDMRDFKLSWLEAAAPVSDIVTNTDAEERLGQYPGKAQLLTNSRRFIDRIPDFRGKQIDLDTYEILSDLTSANELALAVRILESQAILFTHPFRVYTDAVTGDVYAVRIIYKPVTGQASGPSAYLTTEGGDVEGELLGSDTVSEETIVGTGTGEVKEACEYPKTVADLLDVAEELYATLPLFYQNAFDTAYARYGIYSSESETGEHMRLRRAYDTFLRDDADLFNLDEYVRDLYDAKYLIIDNLPAVFDAIPDFAYDDTGSPVSFSTRLGALRALREDDAVLNADLYVMTGNRLDLSTQTTYRLGKTLYKGAANSMTPIQNQVYADVVAATGRSPWYTGAGTYTFLRHGTGSLTMTSGVMAFTPYRSGVAISADNLILKGVGATRSVALPTERYDTTTLKRYVKVDNVELTFTGAAAIADLWPDGSAPEVVFEDGYTISGDAQFTGYDLSVYDRIRINNAAMDGYVGDLIKADNGDLDMEALEILMNAQTNASVFINGSKTTHDSYIMPLDVEHLNLRPIPFFGYGLMEPTNAEMTAATNAIRAMAMLESDFNVATIQAGYTAMSKLGSLVGTWQSGYYNSGNLYRRRGRTIYSYNYRTGAYNFSRSVLHASRQSILNTFLAEKTNGRTVANITGILGELIVLDGDAHTAEFLEDKSNWRRTDMLEYVRFNEVNYPTGTAYNFWIAPRFNITIGPVYQAAYVQPATLYYSSNGVYSEYTALSHIVSNFPENFKMVVLEAHRERYQQAGFFKMRSSVLKELLMKDNGPRTVLTMKDGVVVREQERGVFDYNLGTSVYWYTDFYQGSFLGRLDAGHAGTSERTPNYYHTAFGPGRYYENHNQLDPTLSSGYQTPYVYVNENTFYSTQLDTFVVYANGGDERAKVSNLCGKVYVVPKVIFVKMR